MLCSSSNGVGGSEERFPSPRDERHCFSGANRDLSGFHRYSSGFSGETHKNRFLVEECVEESVFQIRKKLQSLEKEDVILTEYALRAAGKRQIDMSKVMDDILHPVRLIRVERQEIDGEERFKCYSEFSK